MKKLLTTLIAFSVLLTSAMVQAWEPDNTDKLELSVTPYGSYLSALSYRGIQKPFFLLFYKTRASRQV